MKKFYHECECGDCEVCCASIGWGTLHLCDDCNSSTQDVSDWLLSYNGKIRIELWTCNDPDKKTVAGDKKSPFFVRLNLGGWKKGDTYEGKGIDLSDALEGAISEAIKDGWE